MYYRFWIGILLLAAVGVGIVVTRTLHQTDSASTTNANDRGNVATVPVIVELFTSEGCSSCPPADEVLSNLDKTQPVPGAEIIVLSEHVDYWNQLGWADPYSSAELSDRQRDYAQSFGNNGIYTPQMVVDGRAEFNGSDRNRARNVIGKATQTAKAEVQLQLSSVVNSANAATLKVDINVSNIPVVTPGDEAAVFLAITESDLRSSVSRGENEGRELTHTAVVRRVTPVGSVLPGAKDLTAQPEFRLNPKWKRSNVRLVVFVQERKSRHILGAAVIKLAQ